jgi:hypothetical protein
MIALPACLKLPWHRSIRITEPIANIDIRAVTARYRSPAASVFQRIIPARLKARWDHSVAIAPAITLIEIVAVAAWRRMAGAAVPNLLSEGTAFVQRTDRRSELEREDRYGDACEHFRSLRRDSALQVGIRDEEQLALI